MNNFNYYNPTRILFGPDTENLLPEEVKKHGSKVLLHYGGGSIKRNGLYEKVVTLLNDNSIEFVELSGVKPNPVLSMVEEGIALCKTHNIDFILAVGGGSVIDSAKSIAVGAVVEHPVWNFFEGKEIENALPIGVILTIPAAGSESSNAAVLTKEEGMLKRAFGSEHVYPKFAIMNPKNTMTLPDYQTSCGLSDMLCHLFERYFTQTTNNELTDNLLLGAMKTIIDIAPKVLANPMNYDLRADVMITGTYAHNGSLGVGRAEDWASHAIEHELSGYNDVAHGAGLAVVAPAWMKYVSKDNSELFNKIFKHIFNIDQSVSKEDAASKGIEMLKEWYKSINLPTSLTEINVPKEEIYNLANKCVHDRMNNQIGNFKVLKEQDIVNILILAL